MMSNIPEGAQTATAPKSRPTTYAVNETFLTIQGEGVYMGRSAFFIRLQGCPVHCPWCDSAGTWNPGYFPPSVRKMQAEDLAQLVYSEAPGGAVVVITGGEPTQYDLQPLVDAVMACGYRVHLETAGINPLPKGLHWITLSPKVPYAQPLPEVIAMADEIKIIVDSEDAFLMNYNAVTPHMNGRAVVWLHPEWGHRQDPEVLAFIVDTCKRIPMLRAGYQMHKMYRADSFDPNSVKMIIPLGGNPERGNSQ